MIQSTVKLSLLGLTAVTLAVVPLRAAEVSATNGHPETAKEANSPRVSKAERTGVALPFRGVLTAKTDASITIKERVFEVTSETKVTKNDKPATLADGEIGKAVSGQYLKHDGKLVAKLIRFGGKPEAPENSKLEKPKKEKPETKPEAKPAAKTETPVK